MQALIDGTALDEDSDDPSAGVAAQPVPGAGFMRGTISLLAAFDGLLVGPLVASQLADSIGKTLIATVFLAPLSMIIINVAADKTANTLFEKGRSRLPVLVAVVALGACSIVFGWSNVGTWFSRTHFF